MRKLFILSFVFFISAVAVSQINKELKHELSKSLNDQEKKILDKADKYYLNQDYLYALSLYDSLYKKYSPNLYLTYLLGTVQSYDPFYFETSEKLIKAAKSIKDKLPDYDFYLARAFENNEKYDEAIAQYEICLKNPLIDTVKTLVLHQIEVCKNSAEQLKKGTIANITNLGSKVNTEAAEYSPVLPGNEKFIIFTYRGPLSKGGKQKIPGKPDDKGTYFEDVFISYKNEKGEWDKPRSIDAVNTVGHDAVMCVTHDGQKLYLFRSIGNGDIFVSVLKGTDWTTPEKLKGPVNSNFWEGSVCFTPDEKYLYFSSERPNGLGGRDIWIAQRMPDGTYGNIKNLSPVINTPYDEDAPYITADGKTLFFSSTGHNSTGGYDVFRSDLKSGKWSKPFNIGKPVNTNQDDKYYWVSADGERGYYSSERKGGMGSQDIYLVEPGMFGKPTALIMLEGVVYLDDKRSEAEIKIRSKLTKKDFAGTFHSNSVTGEYLINLPAGNEFEVSFTVAGNISIVKQISTVGIDSFIPLKTDANLYSPQFLSDMKSKVDTSQLFSNDMSLESLNFKEFFNKYGTSSHDSIIFKVQVGAYKLIENFNYRKLLTLPPVRRLRSSDGVTRFTIGELKTLNEADSVCKLAKKAGIKDAFIIALYNNSRMGLAELMNGGYFKK